MQNSIKKLSWMLCLTVFVLAVVFLLPAKASAATYGDLTYAISGGEVTITRCKSSASGDLVIPDTIEGYPVTSIGYQAFCNCSNLTSITIPDNVTSIDHRAFSYCSSLTSVTIGDGVTSIGSSAFSYCSNLTNIMIPDSVTNIGFDIIDGCSALVFNTYDNADYLGNDNNPYLVLIKATDTSITTCEINPNTKFIYCYAFDSCINMTSVVIPDGVVSLGGNAFVGCSNLTEITIPDSVTDVGDSLFMWCSGLTNVTLGNGLEYISAYMFVDCNKLTSIVIPDGVTSIGVAAFAGCENLMTVYIPNSVTNIVSDPFEGRRSVHIHYGGSKSQWNLIDGYYYFSGDVVFDSEPGSYTVMPVTTCIASGYYCSGCGHNVSPNSSGALGHRYVGGVCTRCGDDGTWSHGFYDGELYVTGYRGSETEIVIPDNNGFPYTGIASDAFCDCSDLISVTIPDRVTSIGSLAFYNCSSLTSINIPDSVTSIEWKAFGNCSSLTSVVIPKGVTNIDNAVFIGCSGLTSVTISNSVVGIRSDAFAGCSSLSEVTIPEGVATISEWAFGDCSSLTSIVFPASVTYVGDSAFVGCTALTDVYYTGTQAQWESFGLGIDNDPLLLANVHFNYDPSAGVCSHSYGDWVITGVPTFTSAGSQEKTCDLCGDVVSETIPAAVGKVEQWNVSLEDDLVVTFHLNISAILEHTARIRIYVGDDTYNFRTATMEKSDNGLYVASVNIAAAQMSDYIMVSVMNNGAMAQTQSYTVRQYADALLSNAGYSQYHELVREMLNYGAAAQAYFDYSEDALANEGITGAGKVEIPESTDEEMSVTGSAQGIHFYAASLIFRNKISVRYYFNCDGNINGYTFTANGKICMPQLKNGLFYVEVDGIMPEDLDQPVELIVTDGNGDVLTVCYSPMNYIVRMNEKGSESLKALLKALYNYHLAAKALRAA